VRCHPPRRGDQRRRHGRFGSLFSSVSNSALGKIDPELVERSLLVGAEPATSVEKVRAVVRRAFDRLGQAPASDLAVIAGP
jgi:hypothetical protein